ncbi:DUF4129 domain-containing transglutaminase family protein [Metabacillus malikii]|uniref:Transglutaminase-like putative cysteine protease n=1 Tax=Metabacillus malikii TaxID=1504265 RepID=A0ABT9ZME8_9BACI|nr:transglutaminase domain-containing protein [Metabacillus malikii]MDQ0233453.1 transglutaminase-like putative cysteine protease [Metabacillus malikii]
MKTQRSYGEKSIAYVYYIFAFLLLWEWLRPLEVFTDTENTFVFIFFIAVCFILILLKARWFIAFPVKSIIILFVLHGMYYSGVFLSFLWLNELVQDTMYNLKLIPTANWMSMTASYRTLLFFILLWLLVYLIHYWVLIQKRILIFFILTLLYITVLDTFTPYDATYAIVRTVLIGFFMLGMLYFDRIQKLEKIKVKKFTFISWMLPLFVFILLSGVVAGIAPKASPQWPDPVPFITAIGNEGNGIGGTKKIGYSESDDNLGGGFVEDDTEVFTHISSERHYWRVETKDIYTGKGWVTSEPDNQFHEIGNIRDELQWTEETVATTPYESTITFNEEYQHFHVLYPIGLKEVETDRNLSMFLNRNSELLTPFPNGEGNREQFSSYKIKYDLPTYPLNEMKREQSSTSLSNEFMERYTQLPESLPSRVVDLARQITANETNQYDRAKAIEEYLGTSEFTYDKEDVAIPNGNQDYVDQFLFETLKGYCDNFSTSMIVLLRSIDIPARWVKGYTEGNFVEIVNGEDRLYEVTNNNAHSWVEVYFEGVGWVPFEPTKGFVNPYSVTNELEATEDEEVKEEHEQQEEEKPEKPEDEDTSVEEEEEETKAASSQVNGSSNSNFGIGSTFLYSLLSVIVILSIILYVTRMRWMAVLIINKYKKRSDQDVFFQAYDSLLKQLRRSGFKRESSQTLRGFAETIDAYYQNNTMTKLTASYERALYRRDNAVDEWLKSVELWENLIKKTSS